MHTPYIKGKGLSLTAALVQAELSYVRMVFLYHALLRKIIGDTMSLDTCGQFWPESISMASQWGKSQVYYQEKELRLKLTPRNE